MKDNSKQAADGGGGKNSQNKNGEAQNQNLMRSDMNEGVEEVEKTAYEKFEDSVRETIFNVLYVLLKNEEHSKMDMSIEVFCDFVQIYSFTFKNTEFPWQQEQLMFYLEWFFNLFQLDTLYSYVDFITFLAIFYAGILVVILVIIDIFYVSYSFQQKKFKYVWPLKLLRSVCSLLVTALFLNFLELFCNFLKCQPGEEDPSIYVVTLFTDIQCWTGQHLLHASVSIVTSFVFVVICLIAALALYESKESPNDVTAKVSSRQDFNYLIVKIILLYMYSFFYQKEYTWFVIIATFLMSYIIYRGYRDYWPFYSDYTNQFYQVASSLFLWGNFILIFVEALKDTSFDGGIQIYLLGLPIVGFMVAYSKDERVELLNRNINNFQKGEDIALQIRYFFNLVQTKDTDRRNAIILRGYIFHHEDQCQQPDCCLRQYKKLMKQTISHKNIMAQKGGSSRSANLQGGNAGGVQDQTSKSHKNEMQKLLLQHAKNMYRAAIRKFPTCTALRIQYAFFLMQHMKKKQESIAELTLANQFSPAFEEQFIIFRYLKMSEDYDDMGEGGHGGEEIDVVAKFAYESSLRQFQESILQSAHFHAQFWAQLKIDRPDMGLLNEFGQKINKSVVLVEQFWDQLQKLNPNQPQVMKTYSRYLSQVLNDKQRGQELMARAKEATSGKQNFIEGGGGGSSQNDFDPADMHKNGQPCVVVSGQQGSIGKIIMCNQAVCRIFGYLPEEIINHNVEKLMSPIFGRHHPRLFHKALQRGPDHVGNKDRVVYALHKSGYIFPVYLSLKLIQKGHSSNEEEDDEEQSGQFVAIFKIDKKQMSSNIAFLIIDKDRHIEAISSSCLSMLYLDISRVKKLYESGVTIDQFCPDIFQKQRETSSGGEKQQQFQLTWNFDCEYERQSSKESKNSKTKSNTSSDNIQKLRTLKLPSLYKAKKSTFLCSISLLTMSDMGEVAQCVRLENISSVDQEQQFTQTQKGNNKVISQPPLFQFRFDNRNGKFVREVPSEDHEPIQGNQDYQSYDDGTKNLAFLRWRNEGNFSSTLYEEATSTATKISQPIHQEEQKQISPNDIEVQLIDTSGMSQNNNFSIDNDSVDMSQRALLSKSATPVKFDYATIMQMKKRWSKGIAVYRIIDGVFKYKQSNDDLRRQMEKQEEERLRKEMEEENEADQNFMAFDSFSGNLNSKKSLQTALKDRRPIASITRLKIVMNLAVLSLIALAASDYSVICGNFSDMNQNFNIIQQSFGRISEFQRVTFNIRSLIMINEGYMNQTGQQGYVVSNPDFPTFLINDTSQALENLYTYQSSISLSPLPIISKEQISLIYDKSVNLYFLDDSGSVITLKFTLNEAILQILSAIFTAEHLNLTEFSESNKDLHFINMNLFNDLLQSLRLSAEYYVEDLLSRADRELTHIIILFLISAITCLLMLVILFPVVRSVNSARLRILSLFVDIPFSIVFTLSGKCERFIKVHADQNHTQLLGGDDKTEVNSDEVDGNDNNEDAQGEEGEEAKNKKKNKGTRIPIFQRAMNDNTFFLQFGFALILIIGYFIAMLVISIRYTDYIKLITTEMNLLAQAESYYAFAQNIQREMIYDPTKKVLGGDSFFVARDTLEQLYQLNQKLLSTHFDNRNSLQQSYLSDFQQYFFDSNLCNMSPIQYQLIPQNCQSYDFAQQGLQTILTRYFELLKESLKTYVNLKDQLANQTQVAQTIVNSQSMQELYIIQFRYISDSLGYLTQSLTGLTNSDYEAIVGQKVIAFVTFVIVIVFAYLILWLPFVIKLSKDMWRSKSMLSIIPIEVIAKMPRIHQFLLKQSFTDTQVKQNTENKQVKRSASGRKIEDDKD